MWIFPLPTIQILMSEMFDKSQMSEPFYVPAGCNISNKFFIMTKIFKAMFFHISSWIHASYPILALSIDLLILMKWLPEKNSLYFCHSTIGRNRYSGFQHSTWQSYTPASKLVVCMVTGVISMQSSVRPMQLLRLRFLFQVLVHNSPA